MSEGSDMEVTVEIRRFNPEKDEEPHWQTFTAEAKPTDRLLNVLQSIKDRQDGTLAFRRSCAHGICGSDAMQINGSNRLACKVLVKDLGKHIRIEPLRGLPVVKDLIVDMEPFFEKFRIVKPYLINDEPPPPTEWTQSPIERALFDDTTKCILCASCTTSCPSFWANNEYIGPAALVQAHRFIFDSRDRGGAERLEIINAREGVWRCRTIFNCVEACPREINITRAIGQLKKAMLYNRI
jgi:succinate dehydrogenase / fumarate reductase iron-sulfur subunit